MMMTLRSSALLPALGLLCLLGPSAVRAETWAVIAVGSVGYQNYRHQAGACHAFQLLKKKGVKTSNIVLMMEDDVANSTSNPFPGQLFHTPTGEDVYQGCEVSYRGNDVTPKLFTAVLTGDKGNVPKNGPVLQSTGTDDVFVFFIDHGGTGVVDFPHGGFLGTDTTMSSSDLLGALTTMAKKGMYRQLLFYMEACQSGSMFNGGWFRSKLSGNVSVLAATSANPDESSWGTSCPPHNDLVKGKHLNTCLGDLWTVNWLTDSDKADLNAETVGDQLLRVANETTTPPEKEPGTSHPQIYGDTTLMLPEKLSQFQAGGAGAGAGAGDQLAVLDGAQKKERREVPAGRVRARDIGVHLRYYAWLRAVEGSEERQAAWAELLAEQDRRAKGDRLFTEQIAKSPQFCGAAKDPSACVSSLVHRATAVGTEETLVCHKRLLRAVEEDCFAKNQDDEASVPGRWTGYTLKYSQMLWNGCATAEGLEPPDTPAIGAKTTEEMATGIAEACGKKMSETRVQAPVSPDLLVV